MLQKLNFKTAILLLLYMTLKVSFTNAQSPALAWVKGMGGSGVQQGRAVQVDAAGNVYTSGMYKGTVDFDPGIGVFNLSSTGDDDVFISKVDASGNFLWAKSIGGVDFEYNGSLALDASGNVYTTGIFNDIVDFDPGAAVFNLASNGLFDIFISKLDAAGNFVWAKKIGASDNDGGVSVAVDAIGNIYTSGFFRDTVDFDAGLGTFTLAAKGDYDTFITKLDATGNFIWAKAIGGIGLDFSYATAIDPLGNSYTAGWFDGTMDFDPGVGTFNLTSAGSSDIFIVKLNSAGNFVWAKAMGSPLVDNPNSIAIDKSGNVITTGSFSGIADFNPGSGTFTIAAVGANDVFISKLDGAGNFIWAKTIGGTNSDDGNSLTTDAFKNVYSTGNFVGTCDFDPGIASFNLNATGSGAYISKLDSAGNFVWAKIIDGTGTDGAYGLTLDNSGNIYTVGAFENTVDFDPNTGTSYLVSNGVTDIFIQKLCQTNCAVGIEENVWQKNFTIYPNPTTGEFNLQSTDIRSLTVYVFDITGKLVLTEIMNHGTTTINARHLNAGVYSLKVVSSEGAINKKLVIVH